MTDPHHVEDDSGCLRLVLAVPFSLLALIAAFFCRTALTIHPYGAWDRDAFAGIAVSCLLTIGSTGATVMLWAMPSVRLVVRAWWLAPALVFGVVAGVRWVMST